MTKTVGPQSMRRAMDWMIEKEALRSERDSLKAQRDALLEAAEAAEMRLIYDMGDGEFLEPPIHPVVLRDMLRAALAQARGEAK